MKADSAQNGIKSPVHVASAATIQQSVPKPANGGSNMQDSEFRQAVQSMQIDKGIRSNQFNSLNDDRVSAKMKKEESRFVEGTPTSSITEPSDSASRVAKVDMKASLACCSEMTDDG